MLATLVIGLREGMEAVLIVSIIAAFLKRNGISRRPMWIGVVAAVLISIGVGVALQALEQALPQAQQEAMETVIGLIAVVFVTGMVLWMGKNARGLKGELEESASEAVHKGAGWALAGMAFLAVVKEGFETAVFLLATLNASTNVWSAGVGALVGIISACILGVFLYVTGTRMNLAKFFRYSSIFLVFVAAGLVLTAFRTAHEAGWITIGQQRTVDLTWLAPIGSLRSALVTGVLGIPADPRLIEVLAWFAYLIPVLVMTAWPAKWQFSPRMRRIGTACLAGAFALAAIVLPLAFPSGKSELPRTASLGGDARAEATVAGSTAKITITGSDAAGTVTFGEKQHRRDDDHAGTTVEAWTAYTPVREKRPATVTLDDLVAFAGRIPVGVSRLDNPGPFAAKWSTVRTTQMWTVGAGLLDAQQSTRTTLDISGGGLTSHRTITTETSTAKMTDAAVEHRADQVAAGIQATREASLWKLWTPLVCALAALTLLIALWRARRRNRAAASSTDAGLPPTRDEIRTIPDEKEENQQSADDTSAETQRSDIHVHG